MNSKINIRELKAEMVRNDVTQRELASLIGISRSGLYKKLTGQNNFTLDEVRKIRDILNLDNETICNIFLT